MSRRSATRRAISRAARPFAFRANVQSVGNVVEHRHVTEQGIGLEDKADPALLHRQPRGVFPAERDCADRGRRSQAPPAVGAEWSCRNPTGQARRATRRERRRGQSTFEMLWAPIRISNARDLDAMHRHPGLEVRAGCDGGFSEHSGTRFP